MTVKAFTTKHSLAMQVLLILVIVWILGITYVPSFTGLQDVFAAEGDHFAFWFFYVLGRGMVGVAAIMFYFLPTAIAYKEGYLYSPFMERMHQTRPTQTFLQNAWFVIRLYLMILIVGEVIFQVSGFLTQ